VDIIQFCLYCSDSGDFHVCLGPKNQGPVPCTIDNGNTLVDACSTDGTDCPQSVTANDGTTYTLSDQTDTVPDGYTCS